MDQNTDDCKLNVFSIKNENSTSFEEYDSKMIPSSSSSSSSSSKRVKNQRRWLFQEIFKDTPDAMKFIKNEGYWSLKITNQTREGHIKYYRCNRVKAKGKQCDCMLKLIFDSASTEVVVHRSDNMHSCDSINNKSVMGLSDEVKSDIEDLHKKKFKPKAILEQLTLKYGNTHNINQIKNFVAKCKKEQYVQFSISLGVESWLNKNNTIPTDDYKSFIANFRTDCNVGVFRFVASSKALLKHALQENLIMHADATKKLNWQGYSVFVIGTSDRNKEFHIMGIAVCSGETTVDFEFVFQSLKETVKNIYNFEVQPKVLIADASHSIQNAFKQVYGTNVPIKICWEHMRKAVEKKVLLLVSKENQTKILADIDKIQLSENKSLFETAYKLFQEKWSHEPNFLQYFQKQWYSKNQNWYEGISLKTPSTSNGLESMNQILMNEYGLKDRLPLLQFCQLLIEALDSFSNQYKTDKKFCNDAFINPKIWADAYQWAEFNKKPHLEVYDDNTVSFMIPADEKTELDHKDLLDGTEKNFDDYMRKKKSCYNLSLPIDNVNWKNGECSCPIFMKYNICKHLVGSAIRLKLTMPPPELKNVVKVTKRKREDSQA